MNSSNIQAILATGKSDVVLRWPELSHAERLGELVERNTDDLRLWFSTIFDEISGDAGPEGYIKARQKGMSKGNLIFYFIVYQGQIVGALSVQINELHYHGAIGFWIDRQVRGRGIVTAAGQAVVELCRQMGLHRLEINAAVSNPASNRVAEKLGFQLEGCRRGMWRVATGFTDVNTWGLVLS